MKNQSGCVKLGVIPIFLLGALGLVAICAFILNDYSSRHQDDARARYAPPVVTITLPEDGFVTMVVAICSQPGRFTSHRKLP